MNTHYNKITLSKPILTYFFIYIQIIAKKEIFIGIILFIIINEIQGVAILLWKLRYEIYILKL